GSSMAAPHVTGALALLFQKYLPERLTIEKVKQLLFASIDPLPADFTNPDVIRSGKGFLNIHKLLEPGKNINMKSSFVTRPIPRRTDNIHSEEIIDAHNEHGPFVHQNCSRCNAALVNEINQGVWKNEPDLLNSLARAYFNIDSINAFDL